MPKFKFIGDPKDNYSGPEVLEVFGMKFPRDKWVEVPEGKECEKLSNHSHFDADFGDAIATDGSLINDEPKRKGGWPKGKPRKPVEPENADD